MHLIIIDSEFKTITQPHHNMFCPYTWMMHVKNYILVKVFFIGCDPTLKIKKITTIIKPDT